LKTKSNHNVLRTVVRKVSEVDTKEPYEDQEDLPGVRRWRGIQFQESPEVWT